MKTSNQDPEPNGIVQPLGDSSQRKGKLSAWRKPPLLFSLMGLLAGILFVLFSAPAARADVDPPGCTGSGLGISLFTTSPDVHIGDTIYYGVLVFNTPFPACKATEIKAWVVTPDGITNSITLRRDTLQPGESDFYTNVVSYLVRAQDVQADGSVRATANDTGLIHQNDTNSRGGGFQGVNTEVSKPCIQISVQCVGSVGENGAINFTGTVSNCGNNTLVGVTVTNFVNNGAFTVLFPTNLLVGQVAPFSGSWVPLNPCVPSTATLVAQGIDQYTSNPRTVTSSANTTCSELLTPGIRVTRSCPPAPVSPGQLMVFSGSVSNTGNVTLTTIVVVNIQPAPNTPVFTLASLAPGAVATFTGSYPAPADCSVSDTLTARAASVCGVAVTDTVSGTCPILTTPKIVVTTVCPATPVAAGGVLTYTGTVRNTGDTPLKEVVVVNDRTGPAPIFTAPTLAPGASANFTGSFPVPADACSVTASITATGKDQCTGVAAGNTFLSTCPVATAPAIAVTLACPAASAAAGGSITYTGTVRNSGNVTLNNVTVVNSQPAPNTVVFTAPTLAPGASASFTASFTAPANACSVSTTVTAAGNDNCTSAPVSNNASATCALVTTPRIVVTQVCPVSPAIPGNPLTYNGTVSNAGNITLTNVVVLNDRSGPTPVFTAPALAPGETANFTGGFTVAANVCSFTSTSTARAMSVCGVAVTDSVSSTCPTITASKLLVTVACPAATARPGGLLTYSGSVANGGNITLSNVVVVSDQPAPNTALFTTATLAPGASAAFTGSFTVPANVCSVTTTVKATGKDLCSGGGLTDSATATCSIATTPLVAVTLACPAAPAVPGGLIKYTGTVSNPGNVTLNNVTVTSSQGSPNPILTVQLAPGQSESFTFSFTTPADACLVTSTVIATGIDNCSSAVVSNTASATCPQMTSPGIAVTQDCPATPTGPGGLLTYNGSVRNTGNVTLTNVVVTAAVASESAVAPTTTIWVDDDLPAGAVGISDGGDAWTWIDNNPAPFSGAKAHQSNISAGFHQHFFMAANATFPINPGESLVAHVYLDPANVPSEVMLQWHAGTYEHRAYWGANLINLGPDGTAGRHFMGELPPAGQWVKLEVPASAVNLEGQVISGIAFSLFGGRAAWDAAGKSAPGGNPAPTAVTTPFKAATLAPGEVANFTGSFTLPADSGCSITLSQAASGNDRCTGAKVAATSTGTCPLLTSSAIKVTQTCPATPVEPGGVLTYAGTVRNTGNITLANIMVFNDRSGSTPIFTLASLAPGASANFSGSYVTHEACCVDSSTVTAQGQSCAGVTVRDTATRTCTMFTSPRLVVTKVCAPAVLQPGDLLAYSGTVSNAGSITLVNVTVVNNQPASDSPVLGPIILAPGETVSYIASYTVPPDFCGTDTVTASGFDLCTAAQVFNRVTTTCPVITTPRIAVTKNCPASPTPRGGLYTFTGTVTNPGNVTLVDVTVVNDQPANNTPIIGPITLAPGASANFTGSYIAPMDCCEILDTVTARGQDRCTSKLVSATATQVCPLLTTPRLTVTQACPATTIPAGGLFAFSGSVSNSGDITLTNVLVFGPQSGNATPVLGPLELAPGERKTFTGSYTVPSDTSSVTVTATGQSTCSTCAGCAVIDTASCPLANTPRIGGPGVPPPTRYSNGAFGLSFTTQMGVAYKMQYKNQLGDPAWTDLPNMPVLGTGGVLTITDSAGGQPMRLYRVILAP